VLAMVGDQYGSVTISLTNRNGANGVTLETDNATADLCDLIFTTSSTKLQPMAFRIEARGSETASGGKSLQIGTAFGTDGSSLPHFRPTLESGFDQSAFFGATLLAPASLRTSLLGGTAPAAATLDLRGSLRLQTSAVSATSHTFTLEDFAVGFTTTGSAKTATLPASAPIGQVFEASDFAGDASSNNITINAPSGGSINGAPSAVINVDYGSIAVKSMGSDHFIIIGRV